MSGNGGQTSSLKAATTGRPPPDRGRMELENSMETSMEEEFLDNMTQGARKGNSQELQDSWDEEDLYLEDEEVAETEGFSATVKLIFPGGISNDRNKDKGNQGR